MQEYLKRWLLGDYSDLVIKTGPQTGELLLNTRAKFIKPYLLEEQKHKCAICNSFDIHNQKPLVFVLDHIDGDWKNHSKENLRLICPNCNSQLDTTKRHKGRGRYSERYYYRKRLLN